MRMRPSSRTTSCPPWPACCGLRGVLPLLLLLLLAPATAIPARAIPKLEKASLELVADRTAYEPDSPARLAAVMTIEPGWHTNSHRPTFEYLIATALEIETPTGWSQPLVTYPAGEMKSFAFTEQPISVYEGEVAIFADLTVPPTAGAGGVTIPVQLTYQACDDRSCLPPVTTSASVELTVGAGGRPAAAEIFALPGSAPGDRGTSLALMVALAIVGGLILNAMPCVLPVLSLKIFGLVKSAGKGRSQVIVGSLATAAGILLSFWALALAAILARSAGAAVGWGIQFQEPVFVAILAVIVILFCLNLWGLFEIPLPGGLARMADSGPKEGIPGHLFSGLFATLMATPCSAPFLGTAVGFALSQDALTIAAMFTAIAVGMALPYLALAAAPGAARWLPKPGDWMDRFRVLMGFLLAGAAVWLFYVLAAQISRERLAFLELALLGLAVFVWLRSVAPRPWLKRTALAGSVGAIALTLALATGAGGASQTPSRGDHLIDWIAFDRQEAERLAAGGSLVFVDVTADWCFTCKVNERLVLETPEVAGAFERHAVVPMKADWTNRSDRIARYLADHGRYGIPFYLLYRPQQEPHLFAELLTKEGLIRVVEEAAREVRATRTPAR